MARGHRHRLDRRALRVRPRHGSAVDHGRRAHLLGARQEPGRVRPLPRPRRGHCCLRRRLPRAHRSGVGALRVGAAGLRGRQGDQRLRDVTRRRPGVLPRAARARRAAGTPRRGAHGGRAVDGLHGDAHDGERVLPAVPRGRAGDGSLAGTADAVANRDRARGEPRRVSHPTAGPRTLAGAADGAAARGRTSSLPSLRARVRAGRGRRRGHPRRPGGAGTLAARRLRRLRGGGARRLLGRRRSRSGSSTTSASSASHSG